MEKYFSPTFLLFDCTLERVNAYFKPWPWMNKYLRLPIGGGTVKNKHYKNTERYLDKNNLENCKPGSLHHYLKEL